MGRGNNYYISAMNSKKQDDLQKCLITFWGTTHFVLYVLIGYFCPNCFWESFIIGVLFELYEYHAFNCHDLLDIVLNTSGFFVGKLIRRYLG